MERTIDPVDQLEMRVAIGASEVQQRHEVAEALKALREDVRRDIKLWCGLGIVAGNGAAAFVASQLTPGPAGHVARGGLRAVRVLLGV